METTTGDSGSAFSLLHPAIQRELYRMRWTQLRPIQVQAIHALRRANRDVLIVANTAGGKTEAAFLPILSHIIEDDGRGIKALYVSPLKALINDQFRRLEELCDKAEIPVHRWHGDVGQSRKRMFLQQPDGVLLITPESIESLFTNHPFKLASLFSALRFIVIDEIHAFIGTERGAHLKSLLARLMGKTQNAVSLVGLSATIGQPNDARAWLRPDTPEQVRIIEDKNTAREVKFQIRAYEFGERTSRFDEDSSDVPDPEAERLARDLFEYFYGKTALVFGNSRRLIEHCADQAKQECLRRGLTDRVLIHHGSLSRAVREDVEKRLRSGDPFSTYCSTTLELGIDVGDIEVVGQIDPPWTVSALSQRLGRSGRAEGKPSVMRMFVLEKRVSAKSGIIERLAPKLLQAIAMTELMLEGWCEPPDVDLAHLSTLVQQVMSVIAEFGGIEADRLFEVTVLRGGFRNVSQWEFVSVLRSMGAADLVEQSPEGPLILGLVGERIVRTFDFYSAFMAAEEYGVLHNGRTIGSVSAMSGLDADTYLVLAGRRWRILEVWEKDKEILVEPASGARLPNFEGGLGADIHAAVRAKMRDVLCGDKAFAYLDEPARAILKHAREEATALQLGGFAFFHDGRETIWFSWTSARINRTLAALARFFGEMDVKDEGIALVFKDQTAGSLADFYGAVLENPPKAEAIAGRFPVQGTEKYSQYLSEELKCQELARNSLDLPGALVHIKTLLEDLQQV